jgi:hypothetical protein
MNKAASPLQRISLVASEVCTIFCSCVIVKRIVLQIVAMTITLRRKVDALREMTEERGCRPGKAAAAEQP